MMASQSQARPPIDTSLLAIAAAEWGQLKEAVDIGKLKRFVLHFAGTYYADLAEERIAEESARLLRKERERLVKVVALRLTKEEAEIKRRQKAELDKKRALDAVSREQKAWKDVFAKRDRTRAESFLRQFPNSKYAREARKRIEFFDEMERNESITFLSSSVSYILSIAFIWSTLDVLAVAKFALSIIAIIVPVAVYFVVALAFPADAPDALVLQENIHRDEGQGSRPDAAAGSAVTSKLTGET